MRVVVCVNNWPGLAEQQQVAKQGQFTCWRPPRCADSSLCAPELHYTQCGGSIRQVAQVCLRHKAPQVGLVAAAAGHRRRQHVGCGGVRRAAAAAAAEADNSGRGSQA